jgi:chromosome partition protein MukF
VSVRTDPERALAVIAERRLALELGTLDICFLVALYVRGEGAGLTAFSEPQLEDVFAQAAAVAQPGVDQLRRRATLAIQRLRDQRMLARVDGRAWCAPASSRCRGWRPGSCSSSSRRTC